ncbi:MAG: hypothetical protein KKC21_02740 [Nitrospinae bacterium]|nr:hypothetical protein [Nitrospinota bacterium]
MELVCKSCGNKIVVPDDKIPKGKKIAISCPNCREKIVVGPSDEKGVSNGETSRPPAQNPYVGEVDFVGAEEKIALICDEKHNGTIAPLLSKSGYRVRVSGDPKEALTLMRFSLYDLVFINEEFGGNDIAQNVPLQYIQSMLMENRRNIHVVLMSQNLQTLNNMDAYVNSVDLVVNYADLDKLDLIIEKSLKDHDRFYKIFKESLVKLGKD